MLKFKLTLLIDMFPIKHHHLPKKKIIMRQIVDTKPTKIRYVQRSVFMKDVNTQKIWTFT